MKKWKKPTKNFYMMPNEVFRLGLDPYEFMILSYLVRRMNADSECWPSYSRWMIPIHSYSPASRRGCCFILAGSRPHITFSVL